MEGPLCALCIPWLQSHRGGSYILATPRRPRPRPTKHPLHSQQLDGWVGLEPQVGWLVILPLIPQFLLWIVIIPGPSMTTSGLTLNKPLIPQDPVALDGLTDARDICAKAWRQ